MIIGKNLKILSFLYFCNEYRVSYEFSSPKTPQKNGVIERKIRTLQEMAHVMLNSKKLSKHLWAEDVNTTCHSINHVYFCPSTKKAPYELWKGKKSNVSYFHIFGSIYYILNDRETWLNLMLKVILVFFLVIPLIERLIMFLI